MADLRLPGLMTGIDTAALVKQLMIVNSRRLATYQVKKLDYERQASAIDELRSKVKALDTAVELMACDDRETRVYALKTFMRLTGHGRLQTRLGGLSG